MSDSNDTPPGVKESPPAPAGDAITESPNVGPRRWRRLAVPLLVLVVLIFVGIKVARSWHLVSTDDAYVNGHVTFVAPRVIGQVTRVLVDDNNRVRKGDVLLELDPEPYQVQVAIKQAAVDAAQAEITVAQANARSAVGQLRGLRFKLEHSIEEVHNQVAIVRARVATWEQSKATLALARTEFERAKQLLPTKAISVEEFDRKQEALDVAQASVTQALESVYQARVALGLAAQPADGAPLTEVPDNLDQTFSSVREALGELMQGGAKLGIVPSSFDMTPKQLVDEFLRRDPGGDVDRIYAEVVKQAPELKQAEVKLEQARRDLDQAKLDLRYCTIRAEIDGVVTRRNVNPGNHVQVGQSLMAVRSLREVWVDANFKETQLRDLRIGQRVELKVDMYGSRQTFEGRISGFTMGTGSTLALLPAQNATGNFVKVVQRLPVRIDIVDYDAEKVPLFVGLSVEPSVDVKSTPTGPNAGKFLQEVIQPTPSQP
ncbi:HlyD family secretion protein [Roseimicrobium sp. ORNL1]|uniref:HlyD family secretion protein n=1 Tax=Roseimicrobium sp. ORNL1 TaxID=2711231 RepID=UPI0013E1C00B|nr:HlyD family secretion protein [Roseimicrobium sp. ORNL1]QIF05449.1 HlyD family secretion protein [Roseimicrobium sp. ORNL1]